MAKGHKIYARFALIATLLALVVIILGTYTRLKESGLGCNDWPGCYGQLVQPESASAAMQASPLVEQASNQTGKEMAHRYLAGSLGLLILGLVIVAVVRHAKDPKQPIMLAYFLLAVFLLQVLLGMWVANLKFLPLVFMGHLLAGMLLAALLWLLTLQSSQWFMVEPPQLLGYLKPWAIVGTIIVSLQIFLGGWTSVNYAALVCVDFPSCFGKWFPNMEWAHAFNLLHPIASNPQGGLMDKAVSMTIQMAHRYGGFVTGIYLGILALYLLFSSRSAHYRVLGLFLLMLLIMEMILGILNIKRLLPITVALSHSAIAALLLLTMITLLYKLYGRPRA